MTRPGRRLFLFGALGLLGTGALAWAGSMVACAGGPPRLALGPLAHALDALPDAAAVGRAWRDREHPSAAAHALLAEPALADGLLPDALGRVIRAAYARGDTVELAGWVVTRLEARIAALSLG